MKKVRINFEKGINNVGDKAIIEEGYATILDNVDLRSGSPRPFMAPQFLHNAPGGTKRHFQFRGKWHYAPNWRDYLGEFIGGIERVYWTEEGGTPMKMVEDKVAQLGTPRPLASLGVAQATPAVPTNVRVGVSNGSGTNINGDYYYAVSAKTEDGILNASGLKKITLEKVPILVGHTSYSGFSGVDYGIVNVVTSDLTSAIAAGVLGGGVPSNTVVVEGYLTYAVDITWDAIDGATSYIIWKGDANNQYQLDEVDASILTYRDDGTKVASGGRLADVVGRQEFEYVYTYERNVGGVTDESGVSYPSVPVMGEYGRLITRDVLNDGYFNSASVKIAAAKALPSATDFPPVNLYGGTAEYNNALCHTKFTLATTLTFDTEDKVLFPSTMQDTAYKGIEYKVVRDLTDVKSFYVKNRNVPIDATTLGVFATTAYVQPVKTKFNMSNYLVSTGDAIYTEYPTISGTSSGLFKVMKVEPNYVTLPIILTSTIEASSPARMKWIPDNDYYKYWNIYRNEQGIWAKVKAVDIWEQSYTDYKPFSALGGVPTSYYTENGQTVDYEPPPLGLHGIESHYGMMFGINGREIRWTPILQPDAWPDTFKITMAFQPLALASFAQGLIVLCEDAIYRIDGNQPTLLSLSKTRAEDGCIAAHSVQKTQQGLVYLSKRGIMLFNGSEAICISDNKIPATSITGPSRLKEHINYYWIPTLMGRNYADFAGEDGITGDDYAFSMDNTNTIEGINKSVRSFYSQGKYFLFFVDDRVPCMVNL